MAHIKQEPGVQTHPQFQAPDPTLLTHLPTSNSFSMAHIKEEPGAQALPQPASQIATQGSHNTTTLTTRTQKAPTLYQRDPILAILAEINEKMAAARRQQTDLIQRTETMVQKANNLIQGADNLMQEANNLIQGAADNLIHRVDNLIQGAHEQAKWMDQFKHKVDTLTQTRQGTQDDISRG